MHLFNFKKDMPLCVCVCVCVYSCFCRLGEGFIWTDFATAVEDNINITLVPVL